MGYIKAPTRGVIGRDNLTGFLVKRGADELANLVDTHTLLSLETDGDAYVLEGTADYSPQIMARHAADALTRLVADGYLLPSERACFDVQVMAPVKANPAKGIPSDPGAIAIVRNQPDRLKLAGRAADAAHAALMDSAERVPSIAVNKYRTALAEANTLERFAVEQTVDA